MIRSSYEERLTAAVSCATAHERPELLAFRTQMYGAESAFADPAWVRWMYDDARGGDRRRLWIYRHDGRIEGQIGAIHTRLRIDDVERDFAWMLDLMVSPAHRMRGAGAVLPKIVQADNDVLGGTEVSEAARKTFARNGWQYLGTLPRWVRPMRGAFARARARSRYSSLLGPALGVASWAMDAAGKLRSLGRRLVPIAAFDERADAVWESAGACWPIVARRDLAWLSWRWDRCPDRRGARAFYLQRGAEVLGWVVLRVADERGVRAGHVVDLFCPPEELTALLALSLATLAEHDVDAVYCLFRAPGASAALASNGFLRRDSGLSMMTAASARVGEDERARLVDVERWFLTAGDSDLDRRRDRTIYA